MKNISFAASKICTFEEEMRLKETWQMFSKTCTTLVGSFDELNKNAVDIINEAAQKADYLIVHITSDEDIRKNNGSNYPKYSQNERALIIANLLQVDAVVIEDECYKKAYEKYVHEKQPNAITIKATSEVIHTIVTPLKPEKTTTD